jgi:hypothetical protein
MPTFLGSLEEHNEDTQTQENIHPSRSMHLPNINEQFQAPHPSRAASLLAILLRATVAISALLGTLKTLPHIV